VLLDNLNLSLRKIISNLSVVDLIAVGTSSLIELLDGVVSETVDCLNADVQERIFSGVGLILERILRSDIDDRSFREKVEIFCDNYSEALEADVDEDVRVGSYISFFSQFAEDVRDIEAELFLYTINSRLATIIDALLQEKLSDTDFNRRVEEIRDEIAGKEADSGDLEPVFEALKERLQRVVDEYTGVIKVAPFRHALASVVSLLRGTSLVAEADRRDVWERLTGKFDALRVSGGLEARVAHIKQLRTLSGVCKESTDGGSEGESLDQVVDWETKLVELKRQAILDQKERLSVIRRRYSSDFSPDFYSECHKFVSGGGYSFHDFRINILPAITSQPDASLDIDSLEVDLRSEAGIPEELAEVKTAVEAWLRNEENNKPFLLNFIGDNRAFIFEKTGGLLKVKIVNLNSSGGSAETLSVVRSVVLDPSKISEALSVLTTGSISGFAYCLESRCKAPRTVIEVRDIANRQYQGWYKNLLLFSLMADGTGLEIDLHTGLVLRAFEMRNSSDLSLGVVKKLLSHCQLLFSEDEDIDFLASRLEGAVVADRSVLADCSYDQYAETRPLRVDSLVDDCLPGGMYPLVRELKKVVHRKRYSELREVEDALYDRSGTHEVLGMQYRDVVRSKGPHDPRWKQQLTHSMLLVREDIGADSKRNPQVNTRVLLYVMDELRSYLNPDRVSEPIVKEIIDEYLVGELEKYEADRSDEGVRCINDALIQFAQGYFSLCEQANDFRPLLTLAAVLSKADSRSYADPRLRINELLIERGMVINAEGAVCYGEKPLMHIFENPAYERVFGRKIAMPFIDESKGMVGGLPSICVESPIGGQGQVIRLVVSHTEGSGIDRVPAFCLFEGSGTGAEFSPRFRFVTLTGLPKELADYTCWERIDCGDEPDFKHYYLRDAKGSKSVEVIEQDDGSFKVEDVNEYELQVNNFGEDSPFSCFLGRESYTVGVWAKGERKRIILPDLGLIFIGNGSSYSCSIDEVNYTVAPAIIEDAAKISFRRYLPLLSSTGERRILVNRGASYIMYEITPEYLKPQHEPVEEAYLFLVNTAFNARGDEDKDVNPRELDYYLTRAKKEYYQPQTRALINEIDVETLDTSNDFSSDFDAVALKVLWLQYKNGARSRLNLRAIRKHLLRYFNVFHSLEVPKSMIIDLAGTVDLTSFVLSRFEEVFLGGMIFNTIASFNLEDIWSRIGSSVNRNPIMYFGVRKPLPKPDGLEALFKHPSFNLMPFFRSIIYAVTSSSDKTWVDNKDLVFQLLSVVDSPLTGSAHDKTKQSLNKLLSGIILAAINFRGERDFMRSLSVAAQSLYIPGGKSNYEILSAICDMVFSRIRAGEVASVERARVFVEDVPKPEEAIVEADVERTYAAQFSFEDDALQHRLITLRRHVKDAPTEIIYDRGLLSSFIDDMARVVPARAAQLRADCDGFEIYIHSYSIDAESVETIHEIEYEISENIRQFGAYIAVQESILEKATGVSMSVLYKQFVRSLVLNPAYDKVLAKLVDYRKRLERLKSLLILIRKLPKDSVDKDVALREIARMIALLIRPRPLGVVDANERVQLEFERIMGTDLRETQAEVAKGVLDGTLSVFNGGTGVGKTFLTQEMELAMVEEETRKPVDDRCIVVIQPLEKLRHEMHRSLRELFYRPEVDKDIQAYALSVADGAFWSERNLSAYLKDLRTLHRDSNGVWLLSYDDEMVLRAMEKSVRAGKSEEAKRIYESIMGFVDGSRKLMDEYDDGARADKATMVHYHYRVIKSCEKRAALAVNGVLARIEPASVGMRVVEGSDGCRSFMIVDMARYLSEWQRVFIDIVYVEISKSYGLGVESKKSLVLKVLKGKSPYSVECRALTKNQKEYLNAVRLMLAGLPNLLRLVPGEDYTAIGDGVVKLMEQRSMLPSTVYSGPDMIMLTRLAATSDEDFLSRCKSSFLPEETEHIETAAALIGRPGSVGLSATSKSMLTAIVSGYDESRIRRDAETTDPRVLVRLIRDTTKGVVLDDSVGVGPTETSERMLTGFLVEVDSCPYMLVDGKGFFNGLDSRSVAIEMFKNAKEQSGRDDFVVVYFNGTKKCVLDKNYEKDSEEREYQTDIDGSPDVVARTLYYLPSQMAGRGTDVLQTISHKVYATGCHSIDAVAQIIGRGRKLEEGQDLVLVVGSSEFADLGDAFDESDPKYFKRRYLAKMAMLSANQTQETMDTACDRLFYLIEQHFKDKVFSRPDYTDIRFNYDRVCRGGEAPSCVGFLMFFINSVCAGVKEDCGSFASSNSEVENIMRIVGHTMKYSDFGARLVRRRCVFVDANVDVRTDLISKSYFSVVFDRDGEVRRDAPVRGSRVARPPVSALARLRRGSAPSGSLRGAPVLRSSSVLDIYNLRPGKVSEILMRRFGDKFDMKWHRHYFLPIKDSRLKKERLTRDLSKVPMPKLFIHVVGDSGNRPQIIVFDSTNANLAEKELKALRGARDGEGARKAGLWRGNVLFDEIPGYEASTVDGCVEIISLKLLRAAHGDRKAWDDVFDYYVSSFALRTVTWAAVRKDPRYKPIVENDPDEAVKRRANILIYRAMAAPAPEELHDKAREILSSDIDAIIQAIY